VVLSVHHGNSRNLAGVPTGLDITVVDGEEFHTAGSPCRVSMRGWRDYDSVADRGPALTKMGGRVRPSPATVGAAFDPRQRHRVTWPRATESPSGRLVIATGARNAIDNIPGLRDEVSKHGALLLH